MRFRLTDLAKDSFLILAAILPMATDAHADTPNTADRVTTTVTGVGTYSDDRIFVFFTDPISSCPTSPSRLDINAAHTAKAGILAIAMTAYTSGSKVRIRPESCSDEGRNVFSDGSPNSYFYLWNE